MDILLLRCGNRALILPRNQNPADCPLLVRLWLGTPYSVDHTEISADMPLPGISPRLVLVELLETGYCALDVNGGMRTFVGREAVAGDTAEGEDGSPTDLLRRKGASPGKPRV
ncbi:hypothetical protein [Cupriavidus pauculus]|uniref:Uncharacterized protein n=1 Tax=Cupriavidus pauculus TaxID=82633 RepID=A0A2N5CB57_9BURK|nr:hypothetical protein [Cupriavidus pauculus]PLP99424.1 hypothetical protein CYJ10_16475 [Cupriavidus pauculus]